MTTKNKAVTDAGNAPRVNLRKAMLQHPDARWYYKPNANGTGFDVYHNEPRIIARLMAHYPKASAYDLHSRILENVTEEKAIAHVEMALRHERENAERQALVGHLFDKKNWKMPSKREVVDDAVKAAHMRDALAHFCGGAEIRCLPNGKYSVGTLGYYHYVGA